MKINQVIREDANKAPEGLPDELKDKWESLPLKRKNIIRNEILKKRAQDRIDKTDKLLNKK